MCESGVEMGKKQKEKKLSSEVLDGWSEFQLLNLQFTDYEIEYENYAASFDNDSFPNAAQVFTSLRSFLLPNSNDPKVLEAKLANLSRSVTAFAAKAISERDAFWSNTAAYNEAKRILKHVGDCFERHIVQTPWCVPVSEKAYFLTALKKSPDAFLAAQCDEELKAYVNELNAAKCNFPEDELKDDGSDLSSQVVNYINQLNVVKNKFKNTNSTYAQNARAIEKKREERWGITNFFVDAIDFISGNESETDKLKRYQNKQQIFNAMEKSYDRIAREARPLEHRATLNSLSYKAINNPSKFTYENIIKLHVAIEQLLKENDSLIQIKILANDLESLIKFKLSSPGQDESLGNLVALLNENTVSISNPLNDVRLNIVTFINEKLNEQTDNPDAALAFIEKLKAAKPAGLDKTLLDKISSIEKDYSAWSNVLKLGSQLFKGTISSTNMDNLRKCLLHISTSNLELAKNTANNFANELQKNIILNFDELYHCEEPRLADTARVMGLHLSFYASIATSKDKVRDAIIKSLDNLDVDKAISHINRWEKLADEIEVFDKNLYQEIQNKKNQYKSLKLLQNGWDNLLNDKNVSELSSEEVDSFISAALWLDKPNQELQEVMTDWLKNIFSIKQKTFADAAKENIFKLKEIIIKDLNGLKKQTISLEKRKGLGARLRFITQANAMYTCELGSLRQEVIQSIKAHLSSNLSIDQTRNYLSDLRTVLPDQLYSDSVLSDIFIQAKKKLVFDHFTKEQQRLHNQYKKELEFLTTGNLGLWDAIKSSFGNADKRAFTTQNIVYWRHVFLDKYSSELKRQTEEYKKQFEGDSQKVISDYLDDLIASDYKSISDPLVEELMDMADLRRMALNRIFRQPSKMDLNRFMFRYLALTEYQHEYQDNPVLAEAGRGFVRQFHELAQHSGGFATEFVAKLSLKALEEMHDTWAPNPQIGFRKNASLKGDIIGKVDSTQDTHIQVPRYLLLNMVLELIVKDFDSLLRNEKIDQDLLKDRIEFVIPKLEYEADFENSLNDKSDVIRKVLLESLDEMNLQSLEKKYSALINSQAPEHFASQVFNRVEFSESRILKKLKAALKDQIDMINKIILSDNYDTDGINKKIEEMKLELLSSTDASYKQLLNDEIENLNKQKILHEFGVYAQDAAALFSINNMKSFVTALNIKFFELLDPKLAQFCSAVKHNLALKELLADDGFIKTRKKLKEDLNNNSINIVDIIRSTPEAITRELSPNSADMVRQLQYRFADRFKHLMVAMLDKNNLASVNQGVSLQAMNKPQAVQATNSWYNFFVSRPKTDISVLENKLTVEERLKEVYKYLNSDSDMVKRMFKLLTPAAESKQVDMKSIYNVAGCSAPIDIPKNNKRSFSC